MALVTCPDCHTQISNAAPACPKCGRPNVTSKFTDPEANKRAGQVMLRVGFWIVAGAIILGLLLLLIDT